MAVPLLLLLVVESVARHPRLGMSLPGLRVRYSFRIIPGALCLLRCFRINFLPSSRCGDANVSEQTHGILPADLADARFEIEVGPDACFGLEHHLEIPLPFEFQPDGHFAGLIL